MSGQEKQLGRIDLSDDDAVAIIETDESEDDDLSDHDAQVVTTGRRNRRHSDKFRSKSPPSRDKNMSSSNVSNRFRRTSARPQSMSPSTSMASNLWKARGEEGVDQSVNLMDAKTLPFDSEAESTRGSTRARAGLSTSMRQKSLVDVFLHDDRPQSRGSSMDYGVEDLSSGDKGGRLRTCLLVVITLSLIVVLLVTVPPLGLFGDVANNFSKSPAPTSLRPTPAPTEALKQEETQPPLFSQDKLAPCFLVASWKKFGKLFC